jgi:ribosomal protein S18 acetylase RimI-like enzyme
MGSMDHVKLPIVVRNATAGDVASMQAVDVEARQRFREIDDARIARAADDLPYWAEGLTRAATEQRAWVAVDDLGAVVGFAVAWVIDGEGHLDELAVTRHTAVVASDVRSSTRYSPGPPLGGCRRSR